MTSQDVKEWLSRAKDAELELNSIFAAKRRAYEVAERVTASPDQERRSGTTDAHRMDELAAYVEELDAQVGRVHQACREVSAVIDAVPNRRHRVLLRYRYLSGMTWERIAVTMKYSWHGVFVLHGRALEAVRLILEKEGIEVHTE